MHERLEREVKLLLPVAMVSQLRHAFTQHLGMRPVNSSVQTSYFYDTPAGDLTAEGISLRLRKNVHADGLVTWQATVKGGGSRTGSVVTKPEEEAVIPAERAAGIMASNGAGLIACLNLEAAVVRKAREVLNKAADSRLELRDSFENERWKMGPLKLACLECSKLKVYPELDLTTFRHKGHVRQEGELECEVDEEGMVEKVEAELKDIVHRFCNIYPDAALGKRTRLNLFKIKIDSQLRRPKL